MAKRRTTVSTTFSHKRRREEQLHYERRPPTDRQQSAGVQEHDGATPNSILNHHHYNTRKRKHSAEDYQTPPKRARIIETDIYSNSSKNSGGHSHERGHQRLTRHGNFQKQLKDKSWTSNIGRLSLHEIMNLKCKPPEVLVDDLFDKLKALQNTMQNHNKMLDKTDVMDAIIKILSKVASILNSDNNNIGCNNKASRIMGEVLSGRCVEFHFQLKSHINQFCQGASTQMDIKVSELSQLFENLLLTMPSSSWPVLPVDELCEAAKLCTERSVNQLAQSVKALYDRAREESSNSKPMKQDVSTAAEEWNRTDYRDVSILPQWEEVRMGQRPFRLQANIITGSYSGWLHYYDTQFRLLREDFITPLRKGICSYLQNKSPVKRLTDIRVYKNVLLIGPVIKGSGITYEIKIDVSRRRYNWNHSKRLLSGSLLCLSPDNFKDEIYFATVFSRDPAQLNEGKLSIIFQERTRVLRLCSKKGTSFTMVESCAYFEASRHILRSLQTAEVDSMPFAKYLIKGECDSVEPPRYLASSSGTPYHLTCLLSESAKKHLHEETLRTLVKNTRGKNHCFDVSNVSDISQWPSLDQTELDASQLNALQMALTQEIAVIQGPPGTGKTYIGLKIVETLLANKEIWCTSGNHSPILVMCYTNHALDQFLEGILDCPLYEKFYHEDIPLVRIGSRSRCERLANFNLTVKRRNVLLPFEVRGDIRRAKEKVDDYQFSLSKYFQSMHKYLYLSEISDEMMPHHHSMLSYNARTPEECKYALEIWLGLCIIYRGSNWSSWLAGQNFERESTGEKLVPTTIQVSKTRAEEGAYHDDEDDSFIDVLGEALIEQSNRFIDDWEDTSREEKYYREDDKKINSVLEFPWGHHFDNKSEYFEKYNVWHDGVVVYGIEMANRLFSREFHGNLPMSRRESLSIDDIHALSLKDRWRLYKYWHSEYIAHVCRQCESEFEEYDGLCAQGNEARKTGDRFALETADVIGMTTTGAAKYQHILHLVKPRIVIVEEAAEVLESHIVSSLNAGTQHLILIGDHKQLRPKPNEFELAKKYKLNVSLFERLILNKLPRATLEIQHRMRPEIAQLVKPHIYETLTNHSSVEQYENVRGVSTNLFFIQHEQPEQEDENLMSHSNKHEAEFLVALCKYFLQQLYRPDQITILVTYTGQLLAMRKLLPRHTFEGVRVCSVDNFQGEENDIILLSLVRSNQDNNVGFLREENRVCVALSRAKKGFYCIGNFKMLREVVPIWENILSDMESKGKLGEGLVLQCSNHPEVKFTAKIPQDFVDNSPKGGCTKNCRYRLECGHVCDQICHLSDPDHKYYVCKKKCTKKCPEGHPCPLLCSQTCRCPAKVTREMPGCNHQQEMLCYQNPEDVKCSNPCKKKCPEGLHDCPRKCSEACGHCIVKVKKTLPSCGHTKVLQCHVNPENAQCQVRCARFCDNGHQCQKKCYLPCGECRVMMEKSVPECNHTADFLCYVKPKHKDCTMPCERILPCRHNCKLPCGKDCLSEKCTVAVEYVPECEHKVTTSCYIAQNPSLLEKCQVKVRKVIPDCNHTRFLPCHVEPERKHCNKPCERDLPCEHKCKLKCREDCLSKPCGVVVTTSLPQCGHEVKTSCHIARNPYLHKKCQIEVEKTLPECNHKKILPCYMEPEHKHCSEPCERTLPCGHKCELPCGMECSSQPCKVMVLKEWPCGHKLKRACFKNASPDPCKFKCKKKLDCGHLCPKTCGEPCEEKCTLKQDKLYSCGHLVEAPCSSTPAEFPCKLLCTTILACGHKCRGRCEDCTSRRIHEPCEYKTEFVRFCGHKVQTPCIGLRDTHSRRSLQILCCHAKVKRECSTLTKFHTCDQLCPWSCPHFSCTKTCLELCDREGCDERCKQKLKCGHQCFGLCGEPCLSLCPKCQLRDFNKKLNFCDKYREDYLYYELTCGHIFKVEYLDTYTQQLYDTKSNIIVSPLKCPVKDCSCLFNCSYRYGNAMKTSLSHVEGAIAALNNKKDGARRFFTSDEVTEKITLIKQRMYEILWHDSPFLLQILQPLDFNHLPGLKVSFLTNTLAQALLLLEISRTQILVPDSEPLSRELKNFLDFLSRFFTERRSPDLNFQVIGDLQSEMFRF